MECMYQCLLCGMIWAGRPGPTDCECGSTRVKWINYEVWRIMHPERKSKK